ncbi:MAG: Lnb N-terminal periplasmic domain-containing protein [Desulfuromonadaceae bacterium]
MTQSFTWFENLIVRFFLLVMAGWGTLAILYSNLPAPLRPWTASLFGVGSLIALVGRYSSQKSRLAFLAAFAVVLVWWMFMPPSNSRNWQPDVAVLPWAEFQGSRVIIHNIRNCDYRSETDYTVRHYDRTFDLATLKSVDLALVYWGMPYIAHTMLSFKFDEGGVVTFSVETRKEIGEEYSNFKGFFRQYELTYVVADERDLIGLRTNYRHEQVYLYRLHESADTARSVFLDYLQKVNSLKEQPQWYNALTDNCTTSFRISKAPYNPDTLLDWRLIANGFIDEMLYESGAIDTSMPFPELKKRSLINERAKMMDKSPDFSKLIRIGLPGMEQ